MAIRAERHAKSQRANFEGNYAANCHFRQVGLDSNVKFVSQSAVNLFQPDVALDKNGPPLSKIGDTVTYTLTATNAGPLDAPPITCTLSDPLLGLTEQVTLTSGQVYTVAHPYTIPAGASDPFTNTADVVCSPLGFPNVITDTASHTVNLFQPGVALDKSGPPLSKRGDTVTYTLTATNVGPHDAPPIICTLSDPLLGFTRHVTLTSGQVYTVAHPYTIPAGASDPFTNTAETTCSPLGFPNVITDTASHTINLFQPGVALDKSGPPLSKIGDTVTYTLTLSNVGPHDAPPIICTLSDPLLGLTEQVTLTSGQVYTVAHPYTIPAGASDPFTNTADVVCSPLGFPNVITDTASHTVNLFQPGVALDKSGPPLSKIGDTITYNLKLSNVGPHDAPPITCTLSDPLLGLTEQVTLTSGQVYTVAHPYTIPAGASDPFTNTADVVCSPLGFPNVITDTAIHTVNLFQPGVALDKSGPPLSKRGDTVTYTLTATNVGPHDAPPIICTLSDPLLGFTRHVTLTSGQVYTVAHPYTIPAGASDPFTNVADVVCSPLGFPNVITDTASHTINLFQPGVALDKSGPPLSKRGDTVTYTLTATNVGPHDAPPITCTLFDPLLGLTEQVTLTSGQVYTVAHPYTIPAGASDPFTNTADVVCSPLGFPNVITDTASHTVNLFQPGVALDKSGPPLSKRGDAITYTLTLSNVGPHDAPPIICTLSDPLLGFTRHVTLTSGQVYTVAHPYTIPAGASDPFTNVADVVCSPLGFPNVITDTASHAINLDLMPLEADLEIGKLDRPDPVCTGGTLTYTLIYTNHGPDSAKDVYITDTLPHNATYGGIVSQPAGWRGPFFADPDAPVVLRRITNIRRITSIRWYTPTLPANAWGRIVFTVTTPHDPTTITNTVTITSAAAYDPDCDNNEASASTTVIECRECNYALDLRPSTAVTTVLPGETAVYHLTLTNTGSCTDTYEIAPTGSKWPATMKVAGANGSPGTTALPGELAQITLSPGMTAPITVSTTVPITARCYDHDTAVIVATSVASLTVSDASTLTTRSGVIEAFTIAPPTDAGAGLPDATVSYTLQTTNAGNCTSTVDLYASENVWSTVMTPTHIPSLPAGQSMPVSVEVHISPDAQGSASDTVIVSFTDPNWPRWMVYLPLVMRGGAGVNFTVAWPTTAPVSAATSAGNHVSRLTTTALSLYGVELTPPTAAQIGKPGDWVTYPLTVTNIGNTTDAFALEAVVASGQNWSTDVTPTHIPSLPVGQSAPVTVTVTLPVTIPDTASPADVWSRAVVNARSQSDPAIFDASILTTTVQTRCYPYIITEIPVGAEARELALDIAGRRAFVAQAGGFTVVDMDTYNVITTIQTPYPAYGIAYDSEHDRIWVTLMADDWVMAFDGETYEQLFADHHGDAPFSIAYNPANDRIYVVNKNSSTVSVYSYTLALERTMGSWRGFAGPVQIAVDAESNQIYVHNHGNNGQMVVIDGATHETHILATNLLDGFGAAVDPTRNMVYASSAAESKVFMRHPTDTHSGIQAISGVVEPFLLYAIAVNPDVGPEDESRLYVAAHNHTLEQNRFLLFPLNADGWHAPDPEGKSSVRSLALPPFVKNGLAFDPITQRIWISSVTSGVVNVIQDGSPLCPSTEDFYMR